MKDENLFLVYTLKIEAMKRNEHKIIIESKDLQNKEQRSLYGQWNRIFIINNKLYRLILHFTHLKDLSGF